MGRIPGITGALALAMLLAPSSISAGSQNERSQRNDKKIHDNLLREVRHQLLLLPYYSVFDNLLYKVDGDRVTLMGQVVRPTLKADAENALDNQIQVLPVSPMDDQLLREVYRALYGDPVLSRYGMSALPSIHIIVNNDNVTLEGVVDSESDRNLAHLRASSVPNVFSVTNNLVVGNQKCEIRFAYQTL